MSTSKYWLLVLCCLYTYTPLYSQLFSTQEASSNTLQSTNYESKPTPNKDQKNQDKADVLPEIFVVKGNIITYTENSLYAKIVYREEATQKRAANENNAKKKKKKILRSVGTKKKKEKSETKIAVYRKIVITNNEENKKIAYKIHNIKSIILIGSSKDTSAVLTKIRTVIHYYISKSSLIHIMDIRYLLTFHKFYTIRPPPIKA